MVNEKYLTTVEIAARWGKSRQWVWRLVKQGKLPAIEIGNQYAVRLSDLERYEQLNNRIDNQERAPARLEENT
jgi:excisionase family DNA binding protein